MTRIVPLFGIVLMLVFSALAVWPDEAEARRFGGGSSFGGRGSRSFSTPRMTQPSSKGTQATRGTQTTRPRTSPASPSAMQNRPGVAPSYAGSGMRSGLLGGLGGLVLGGVLGSMLFGGGEGAVGAGGAAGSEITDSAASMGGMGGMGGSGMGLLEILLLLGLAWFAFRWFKRQKLKTALPAGGPLPIQREVLPDTFHTPFSQGGSSPVLADTTLDDLSQGLQIIANRDPSFDEALFLEGAQMAFKQLQEAWSDWRVERLRPLLTDRVWKKIQAQAAERKTAGRRDIIEKIRFDATEISEAWQEAGEDWITVHFTVDMLDYTTDVSGNVLEGDPHTPTRSEEYWTFTRPVNSPDPNWRLAAIQQPGEVARH